MVHMSPSSELSRPTAGAELAILERVGKECRPAAPGKPSRLPPVSYLRAGGCPDAGSAGGSAQSVRCTAANVLLFLLGAFLVPAGRAESGAGDQAVFRAGAATADITPKPGVLLDGIIMQIGPVQRVHDELRVRALVLDDGTSRVAIAICDACMLARDVCENAASIVNQRTGLPPDRLLCAATHSHCAIRAVHAGTGPLDDEYHGMLAERIGEAVARATENLAPARIGWASVNRPEYPRCRRWLMEPRTAGLNPFGEDSDQVKMTHAGARGVVKPAGPVDPELFVLSVQHTDGHPLAVLSNYAIHYVGFSRGVVSADYFGCFAGRLEELLQSGVSAAPFVAMMSNGTSGDTNADSGPGDPFDRMQKVGRSLADSAERLCREASYHEQVSIAVIRTEIELRVRRPAPARLEWAQTTWVKAQQRTAGGERLTRPEVYARETIHLSRFPGSISLVLQAVRIGDLAIVALPCEVFAETGLAIKQASGFPATFTICLANGYGGYLPPPGQHELGGYTTWPARSSFLEIQAEPKIRQAVLGLLRRLADDAGLGLARPSSRPAPER